MRAKSGSILVLTVWALSFLAIFAIGLGCNIASQVNFVSYFKNRIAMYYLSRAGIERGIVELFLDDTVTYDTLNDSLSNNEEVFKEHLLESGCFTVSHTLEYKDDKETKTLYGLSDECSKININYAQGEILESLLETLGDVREGELTDIADAIKDWRDEDIVPSPRGAEDEYYRSLEIPYECKDGKFEVLEELLLIRGMTPEIYSKIKGAVTVYGNGRININTVGLDVLQALGLSKSFAERIIKYRQGDDEEDGTEDDNIFDSVEDIRDIGPLFTEESIVLNQLISQNILTTKSDVFGINSFGILENKKETGIFCIIERKEQGKVKMLHWREE